MRRIARTLILGMILVGMAAIPVMSQATQQYLIGDVKIIGSKQLSPNFIQSILGLTPGKIYNESQLRNGFENLKRIYADGGYLNFTPLPVRDIDEQKKVVNLTISIDEDRQFAIRHINFTGNTTTSDDVVRRELLVQEGQIFNSSLLERSLLRLNQTGYFEEIRRDDVQVNISATDPEPLVDINFKVSEKGQK
jgi:outer membrane protein insertion porin family